MEEQKTESEFYFLYLEKFYMLNRLFTEQMIDRGSFDQYYKELQVVRRKINDQQIDKNIISFLRRYRSEAIYINTSQLISFLLKEQFKIDVKEERFIFKSFLNVKHFPEAFVLPNDVNVGEDSFLKDLEYCINEKLLTSKNPLYEFNSDIALKILNTLAKRRSRIFTYEKLFIWFPDYFSIYYKNCDLLLNQKNDLPLNWRYYIAIMAVSTIKSEYMLKAIEELFISIGGEVSWMTKGLTSVPEKLQSLAKINNILAYQPWKFSFSLIKEICSRNSENSSKSWNTRELIHACLIMIFFQKIAILVEAIMLEENYEGENKESNSEAELISEDRMKYSMVVKEKIKKLVTNLQILRGEQANSEFSLFKNDTDQEDWIKTSSERSIRNDGFFKIHTSNFCTQYNDFDQFTGDFLSNLEFNWYDQGYDIINKYDNISVDHLNDEINFVVNLTSNSIGEDCSKINTNLMRKALSCYIECIFGYVNKGFDYSQVNKLLHINQKIFIKNVCCNPHKITHELFSWMSIAFTKEEILHIILLSSIIKMRLQLTYIAKAIHELQKTIE